MDPTRRTQTNSGRPHFQWNNITSPREPSEVVDSSVRMRLATIGFWVLAAVVGGRVLQLEVSQGAAFRKAANEPLRRQQVLPASRGRILAHDGTVLAADKQIATLAVQYRWLEDPPNRRWLNSQVRRRLARSERRDRNRVAGETARFLAERDAMHARLATLCDVPPNEWQSRRREIQRRVERIARSVNARHGIVLPLNHAAVTRNSPPPPDASPRDSTGVLDRLIELLRSDVEASREPIVVAEELDYHVMARHITPEVVAAIESDGLRFPSIRVQSESVRDYPHGTLAAHVLGYLGPPATAEDSALAASENDAGAATNPVGLTGIESALETFLRGQPGRDLELTNRSGDVLHRERIRGPQAGGDVVLTLDAELQGVAESLLDHGVLRRPAHASFPGGGAIVVLDVNSGAIRALASAPRYDPNSFAGGQSAAVSELLAREDHPLYHRAVRMALPPGSVFKPLVAVALLESGGLDGERAFTCRGYLDRPDQYRCQIFRQHGIGHGQLDLAGALAQSCNVYFFHHADRLGPTALLDWALRFGLGEPTGVEFNESNGRLSTPESVFRDHHRRWHRGDTLQLAIGQGPLTVTPLKIAQVYAAIANGGRLVTPHVVRGPAVFEATPGDEQGLDLSLFDHRPPRRIPGLSPESLEFIRRGLNQVVASPEGTAYRTVRLDEWEIAGKTSTAQSGGNRPDHAWFAGYAPADNPQVAFVVVLEHAGSGATAAGPIVRRLVRRMGEMGYFTPQLARR